MHVVLNHETKIYILTFQKYGQILDVEIIFNERGSKVNDLSQRNFLNSMNITSDIILTRHW